LGETVDEFNAIIIKDFLEENFAAFQGFISARGIDESEAEIIIDSIKLSQQDVKVGRAQPCACAQTCSDNYDGLCTLGECYEAPAA
jgi:hypothetical protein